MPLKRPLSRAGICRLALCASAVLASAAHGQNKAPASNTSGRDPASMALRDKMIKSYRDLHGIREKITQKQWQSSPDQALDIEIEFRYRKPNLLYLSIDYPNVGKPGRWKLTYACNGKTLTVYNSARNEYQSVKAPGKLDRIVLPAALRGPEFILLLRDASPFDDLEKSALVRYSEALESPDGQAMHTLRLDIQEDGAKRTLRYRMDPKDNLVRSLALGIVPDPNAVNPFADPENPSTVEARYTLVEINPRFLKDEFAFTPPVGATEKKPQKKTAEGAPKS